MRNHEWLRQRERRARQTSAETDVDAQAQAAVPDPADEAAIEADRAALAPQTDPHPAAQEPREAAAVLPDQPVSDPPLSESASAEAPVPQEARAPNTTQSDASVADANPDEGDALPQPSTPAPAEDHRAPQQAAAREVAERIDVPLESFRDRLEAVLAHQTQLPLDIEARQAVSRGVEGSPRATREELVQRLLDPTLTLEEVSVLLGVCRTTVRRYTDRGVLRCFRTPGNQRRFHLSDILDYMEQQSRQQ